MNITGSPDKIRQFCAAALLLLFFGVGAVYNYRNTMDFQILDPEEFTMPDSLRDTLSEGTLELKEGPVEIDSPQMWLERGSYVFGVTYDNLGGGTSSLCLYSPGMMDEDGNIGITFDRIELEQGSGRALLHCVSSQDISNLELQIFCEDGGLTLSEISMRNEKKMTDPLWLYALGVLLTAALWRYLLRWRTSPQYKEKLMLAAAFSVLIFLAMVPYLNRYLIIGDDLKFHLARINGISTAVRNGDLWPRINPVQAYGYGYASALMYPQVFLYPAALLHLAGMSLMNSYKCLVFLLQLSTAFSSYAAFGRMFRSRYAGIMGAFLYVLSLNRLTNLYVRADLGEMLAMIFFPMMAYAMYEILYRDHRKWYWAAAAFTGIFFSHILSAELTLVVAAVTCLFCIRRFIETPQRFLSLCKAAGITVLLCLWQIVPILTYTGEKLTVFGPSGLYLPDWLVTLTDVVSIFSDRGLHSLGIALGTGAGVYLVIDLYYRGARKKTDGSVTQLLSLGRIAILWACVTFAMTLWIFPWDMLCRVSVIDKLIKSIQFPWRLLTITNLMLCIASVAAFMILIGKRPRWAAGITLAVCAGCVAGSFSFIQQASVMDAIEKRAYAENTILTDYLYLYEGESAEAFKDRGNLILSREEDLWRITDYNKEGVRLSAVLTATKEHGDSQVEVPLYYYPGYRASINGVETPVERGDKGTVRVMLPAGSEECRLSVWFEDPALWKIADAVSAAAFGAVVLYLALSLVKKGRRPSERAQDRENASGALLE